MKIGDMVKVYLPGESPWAECVAINEDGTWLGRIDNHLIGSASLEERTRIAAHFFPGSPPLEADKHPYKFNDVLRFKRDMDMPHVWVPDVAH